MQTLSKKLSNYCYSLKYDNTIRNSYKLLTLRAFFIDHNSSSVKEEQKEMENNEDNNYDDLSKYMHGRGNQERRDSVSKEILLERKRHLEKLMEYPIDSSLLKVFKKQGLGQKKRRNQIYQAISQSNSSAQSYNNIPTSEKKKTITGAGGFARYITSASKEPWPIFKHLLPEIAFAGHSNSGKSTLVNGNCNVIKMMLILLFILFSYIKYIYI